MCSAHCLREPKGACVSLSLEVGNTFFILIYSQAKWQKCVSCRAILHSEVVFFRFTLIHSQVFAGYALCCMFFFSEVGVPTGVKEVLDFPKTFSLNPGNSIKFYR